MKQHEIAALFTQMADLLELRGDNPFRIRAYRKAAQNLESLTDDVERLARENRLRTIPGIGQDLSDKIREYLTHSSIQAVERLKRTVPAGVIALMDIPGIGPKTAKLLYQRLHITSMSQLETAARAHQLRRLPGFQETKEQNILKGISIVRKGQERMDLGLAFSTAWHILEVLRSELAVKRIEVAGSLRRMKETIGDLDILAASTKPASVMRTFSSAKFCARVLAAGDTKSSILTPEGVQVDLRVVDPESFGAALQHFTGSKEHNVHLREMAVRKGLKINEYGVFSLKTGKRLAGTDDLRGDFHIHTNWSDGHHTLEAAAEAGAKRGYQYLVICDHSKSLKVAGGLREEELKEQMRRIAVLNKRFRRFQLLRGAEVDILNKGAMDYPDTLLRQLDVAIGSIHSGFKQDSATITNRLVTAMRNPYVTMIAHPTGRLMGQREAYAVDLEAVFAAAKKTQTALEMNAYPKRLDLNDVSARRAKHHGVKLAISTDTHSLDQLENITIGIGVARRAWLGPQDLLNCLTREQLLAWVRQKRRRAP